MCVVFPLEDLILIRKHGVAPQLGDSVEVEVLCKSLYEL